MTQGQPEDYLWDRSGTPDPEIAHLERALGRFRQSEALRPLPSLQPRGWWEPLLWSRGFRIAAAVGVMLFAVAVTPGVVRRIAEPAALCKVFCVAGAPRVDGLPLTSSGSLAAGGVVETGSASQVEVRFGLIGRITVYPDSRLRVVEVRRGRYRMALDHGKIFARTLAPPFTFVVDTPGPTAYDLGCSFTMETDARGSGRLQVLTGWVQLEWDDRQVLIPGGAVCPLRPGGALGTPYFEDTGEAFRSALARLDFEQEDPPIRAATLSALLAAARPRDAYSLMEMLNTSSGEERRRIVDRAMELVPPPPDVTRAGLLRGDPGMMDAWRKQLGLGEVKRWWIHWRDLLPG
jgi:hypothetical protein